MFGVFLADEPFEKEAGGGPGQRLWLSRSPTPYSSNRPLFSKRSDAVSCRRHITLLLTKVNHLDKTLSSRLGVPLAAPTDGFDPALRRLHQLPDVARARIYGQSAGARCHDALLALQCRL